MPIWPEMRMLEVGIGVGSSPSTVRMHRSTATVLLFIHTEAGAPALVHLALPSEPACTDSGQLHHQNYRFIFSATATIRPLPRTPAGR
jgi:hypothetical protein